MQYFVDTTPTIPDCINEKTFGGNNASLHVLVNRRSLLQTVNVVLFSQSLDDYPKILTTKNNIDVVN